MITFVHVKGRFVGVSSCQAWYTCGTADNTLSFTPTNSIPVIHLKDAGRAQTRSTLPMVSLSPTPYPSHYNDWAVPVPGSSDTMRIGKLFICTLLILPWSHKETFRSAASGVGAAQKLALWTLVLKWQYCNRRRIVLALWRRQVCVSSVLHHRLLFIKLKAYKILKYLFDMALFLVRWPNNVSICFVCLESYPSAVYTVPADTWTCAL
jgi:hypothetical protein